MSVDSSRLALSKVPPELLGKVGESFAMALHQLNRRVLAVPDADSKARRSALARLSEETERLEQLGVQIQRVARVLAGTGMAEPETLDLAAAARAAVEGWASTAQRKGVQLSAPTAPVQLEAVAGVVEQLLDLALDVALRIGERVEVNAYQQGGPLPPMISLEIRRPVGEAPLAVGDDGLDDLHWQLFTALARAHGLSPHCTTMGQTLTLMLSFPVSQLAFDEPVWPAEPAPRTTAVAGHLVLLVEPDDLTRLHADQLLSAAHVRVDMAASLAQARVGFRKRVPDALILGVPLSDDEAVAFVEELRRLQPRLHIIELVDNDTVFDLPLPGSGVPARVSRHDLDRTLLAAVAQELDLDLAWVVD